MYKQYFGLSEAPFSIAPDPRYLYLSDQHREALAHLIYGVGDQGGFLLLTGEVGTGKTTICRCLLQQVPDNADIAFIINPKQSINQLLQSIFKDLHIPFDRGSTSKDLIDDFNDYLIDAHRRGRNTILIIDEAQNLSVDVLEQLRLLTNLETNEKKLLQLVLLGQPELKELLDKPELRQLAQRVTARYHLSPLSKAELNDYIQHRLAVAGCRSELFSQSALKQIYRHAQGIPRLINLLCDRCLLGVYANNADEVTPSVVNKAAKEVFSSSAKKNRFWWFMPAGLLVILGFIFFFNNSQLTVSEKPGQQAAKAVVPENQANTETLLPEIKKQLIPQNQPEVALKQLYALWKLPFTQEQAAGGCRSAVINEEIVYCSDNKVNTLDQLLTFNYPAVIGISNGDNTEKSYALLSSVKEQTAILLVGEEEYSISLDELHKVASSPFYLLSRIPGDYRFPVEPGMAGKEVTWLKLFVDDQGMNDVQVNVTASPAVDIDLPDAASKLSYLYSHYLVFDNAYDDTYSESLEQLVVDWQKKLGVEPNAVVDISLLMAIAQQLHQNDPVLKKIIIQES